MKCNFKSLRICALVLAIAFLMIVFSSLIFVSHNCHHSDSCTICSYYKELNKSQIIPLLLLAFTFIVFGFYKLIHYVFSEHFSRTTPIKLRVKLSD